MTDLAHSSRLAVTVRRRNRLLLILLIVVSLISATAGFIYLRHYGFNDPKTERYH